MLLTLFAILAGFAISLAAPAPGPEAADLDITNRNAATSKPIMHPRFFGTSPPDSLPPGYVPGEVTPYGYVKCNTDASSPTFDEIDKVAESLKSKRNCCQWNPGGTKCTTQAKYKGAELKLCGNWLWVVDCQWLGWAAEQIKIYCGVKEMSRAGGSWIYDDSARAFLL